MMHEQGIYDVWHLIDLGFTYRKDMLSYDDASQLNPKQNDLVYIFEDDHCLLFHKGQWLSIRLAYMGPEFGHRICKILFSLMVLK